MDNNKQKDISQYWLALSIECRLEHSKKLFF